jgi:hypothetical protein
LVTPQPAALDLIGSGPTLFDSSRLDLDSMSSTEMPKPKSVRMSDWSRELLSAQQLAYAAHDAAIGRYAAYHS